MKIGAPQQVVHHDGTPKTTCTHHNHHTNALECGPPPNLTFGGPHDTIEVDHHYDVAHRSMLQSGVPVA